jgi:hypothetical protein
LPTRRKNRLELFENRQDGLEVGIEQLRGARLRRLFSKVAMGKLGTYQILSQRTHVHHSKYA